MIFISLMGGVWIAACTWWNHLYECHVRSLAWDLDKISRALMNTRHAHGLVVQHNDNNKDYEGVLWLVEHYHTPRVFGSYSLTNSVTLASLRRSRCILEGLRGTPRINLLGQWLLRLRKFNHVRDFWLQQQQSLHLPLFPFAQQPIQAWSTDNQRPSYHVHNFNVYLDVSNKVLTLGYLVLEKL